MENLILYCCKFYTTILYGIEWQLENLNGHMTKQNQSCVFMFFFFKTGAAAIFCLAFHHGDQL